MKPENCGYCAACARDDFANCTTFTRAAPLHAVDAPVGGEVVWKITPPMSRKYWFTDDPEEVAHFRLPGQGHEIVQYRASTTSAPGMASVDAAEPTDAQCVAMVRELFKKFPQPQTECWEDIMRRCFVAAIAAREESK